MTEQPLPLTQTQDRDLRLGRLEGLADQFVEQSRETNVRLGRMEQTIAEQGSELRQAIDAQGIRIDKQGSRIDEQGSELRQAIDAQGIRIDEQGRRIDEQGSELRQAIAEQGIRIDEQGSALRQEIAVQSRRIEVLTRWLVGMQVASLVALGTLILVRLP